jgi:hypothetical protein
MNCVRAVFDMALIGMRSSPNISWKDWVILPFLMGPCYRIHAAICVCGCRFNFRAGVMASGTCVSVSAKGRSWSSLFPGVIPTVT